MLISGGFRGRIWGLCNPLVEIFNKRDLCLPFSALQSWAKKGLIWIAYSHLWKFLESASANDCYVSTEILYIKKSFLLGSCLLALKGTISQSRHKIYRILRYIWRLSYDLTLPTNRLKKTIKNSKIASFFFKRKSLQWYWIFRQSHHSHEWFVIKSKAYPAKTLNISMESY